MSIFGKSKEAIFGKRARAAENTTSPIAPVPQAPVSVVDVEANLTSMAGSESLNWRTSIVDLMKLIGIDSSYANRKELAHELGNADYSGSSEDNILLHTQVMQELAKNGGKVPTDLLD